MNLSMEYTVHEVPTVRPRTTALATQESAADIGTRAEQSLSDQFGRFCGLVKTLILRHRYFEKQPGNFFFFFLY